MLPPAVLQGLDFNGKGPASAGHHVESWIGAPLWMQEPNLGICTALALPFLFPRG